MPRYPIFIPSKGRAHVNLTAHFMRRDGIPFKLVVEPQEREVYAARFGADSLLVLPDNNRGLIFARNWIRDLSIARGDERHWQIDDNVSGVWRFYKGLRLYCEGGPAIRACEDFTDRYSNVGLSGLNYVMFASEARKPFVVNVHVYSFTLFNNALPYRFREPANEDVDMCLQVLSAGWCTIQFNAFLAQKLETMIVRGGQTDAAYRGDGRLFMARALERKWPGIVTTARRFGRPQHVVKNAWRHFDTPLKLKEGIDLSTLTPADEYGLSLVAKGPVKSERLRTLLKDQNGSTPEDHA